VGGGSGGGGGGGSSWWQGPALLSALYGLACTEPVETFSALICATAEERDAQLETREAAGGPTCLT